jgi:hypothetical protein
VRLRDLEAEFLRYTGNGTHRRGEIPLAEADGILFICPKCYADLGRREGAHSVLCWFVGRVPDNVLPGPGRWTPTGTGIDDLTFVPSPGRSHSVALTAGCLWHGFVSNGDAS